MITTHLAVLVNFYDTLDQYRASTGVKHANVLDLFGKIIGYHPSRIEFAKATFFVAKFFQDAGEAINLTSIKDANKEVMHRMVLPLSEPFNYPFRQEALPDLSNTALSPMVRSHIDLLNDIMIREVAFCTPSAEDIASTLGEMEMLRAKFENLNVSAWIKADFEETISLHMTLLRVLPEMSHRVLFETQKTLASYLALSLAPAAKGALLKCLIAVNALLAAYVLPSEANEASANYYRWITGDEGAITLDVSATNPMLPRPHVEKPKPEPKRKK